MRIILDKLIIVRIILLLYFLLHISSAKDDIPVFYIFGDSLVDVGNNFYFKTLAIPEFPNGIDFGNPYGTPSGRFTNGRTVNDILEQEAGLKNFTPPYLASTTTVDVLLKGVNFASSAAGILSQTGAPFKNPVCLKTEISWYAKARQDIIAKIGASAAKKLLNRAIHFLAIGSNDVLIFAQRINSRKEKLSSLNAFLDTVVSSFRLQLTRLHKLGARKLVVTNAGAGGCIPYERDQNPLIFDGCVPDINQIVQEYNKRLKRLLEELNTNLIGSTFILADIYTMVEDLVQNYISYGFEIEDKACCHLLGLHGGKVQCKKESKICSDRTKYVFWDAWHLTESANLIMAKHAMDGGPNYMSPMNLRQLLNSSIV